ncbi:hypothetical protein RF11_00170 [Thelohanellus kitauei]|uniref:RRM domain-containing protein n=1 Tax=Thelohanellus kitauei TaxID=669202 RepID=A0A0C2MSW8_THEKT|nr:hypothetical protein RF11_00170 [Thelohanellus kitauei]
MIMPNIRLFSEDSVMDHIFLDQAHRRSEGQNSISYTLSEIYRDGIKITLRTTYSQDSPLFPFLVVTVLGLFTYNHSSWPFVHVFYITSTFYSDRRFCITNSILYDCINPSQILTDGTLSFDNHTTTDVMDERVNNFLNIATLTDEYDQFSISEPRSYASNSLNIQSKILSQTSNNNPINGSGIYFESSSGSRGTNLDGVDDNFEMPQLMYDAQRRDTTSEVSNFNLHNIDYDFQQDCSNEVSYDVNSLYVGGYPDNTTTDDLYKLFSKYGQIQGVKMYDAKKMSFITYKNASSALAALKDGEIKFREKTLRVQQKRVINNVKSTRRENLELYGYPRDNKHSHIAFVLVLGSDFGLKEESDDRVAEFTTDGG